MTKGEEERMEKKKQRLLFHVFIVRFEAIAMHKIVDRETNDTSVD